MWSRAGRSAFSDQPPPRGRWKSYPPAALLLPRPPLYPRGMIAVLANPQRFMAFSRWAAPLFGVVAAVLVGWGLWLGFAAPEDYQQGDTVRIMFIHVPAAWLALFAYACLGGASFFGLVFRHALATAAARAAAPLGAGFTALALVTGSLWGRPMWGTWWVWDARLTSVLVLELFYLGYLALQASIEDEAKADRASAILALVGLANLPIVHFSVNWWNTLHQGSIINMQGSTLAAVYLWPLLLVSLGYTALFGALWLVRTRAEVWRRRARALALKAAGWTAMLDLDMGKYAAFVWPAYAVTVVILGGLIADSLARARRWRREAERLKPPEDEA